MHEYAIVKLVLRANIGIVISHEAQQIHGNNYSPKYQYIQKFAVRTTRRPYMSRADNLQYSQHAALICLQQTKSAQVQRSAEIAQYRLEHAMALLVA